MKIQQDGKNHIIEDTTDGGYITRFSQYTCDWKTVWNEHLELVEFYFQGQESFYLLNDKEDFDYNRARRAVGRHNRALKEMLGLVEEKRPKEPVPIVYFEKHSLTETIQVRDAVIYDKTVTIQGRNIKKHNLKYAELTDENLELAEEYNRKLKEFNQYKQETFNKLFNSKG